MQTLAPVTENIKLTALRPDQTSYSKAHAFLEKLFERTKAFARKNKPSPFILVPDGWNDPPHRSQSQYALWAISSPKESFSFTRKQQTCTLHIFSDNSAIVSIKKIFHPEQVVPMAFSLKKSFQGPDTIHFVRFADLKGYPHKVLAISYPDGSFNPSVPLLQSSAKESKYARKARASWKAFARKDVNTIVKALQKAPCLARDFSSVETWLRKDFAITPLASVISVSTAQREETRSFLSKIISYLHAKFPDLAQAIIELRGASVDTLGQFQPAHIVTLFKDKDHSQLDPFAAETLRWLEHYLCEGESILPHQCKFNFSKCAPELIAYDSTNSAEHPASAHETIELIREVEGLMARHPVPESWARFQALPECA